jgi:HSP20 family protein
MKLENIKENVESFWGNVTEGWRHLWNSGAYALTNFIPDSKTNMPASSRVDDHAWKPTLSWSLLGGDVYEDENNVVVRLETPGMKKEDIGIEIEGETLVIRGEKRFESENTQGRWRVMQCAYGSFRRLVPLPAAVKIDAAQATYKNGVLRVELPKLNLGKNRAVSIKVQ